MVQTATIPILAQNTENKNRILDKIQAHEPLSKKKIILQNDSEREIHLQIIQPDDDWILGFALSFDKCPP